MPLDLWSNGSWANNTNGGAYEISSNQHFKVKKKICNITPFFLVSTKSS